MSRLSVIYLLYSYNKKFYNTVIANCVEFYKITVIMIFSTKFTQCMEVCKLIGLSDNT